MANEKDIKIKIVLNDGGTSATLKNINNQIISSKVPIKELRKELGNFVVTSKNVENTVEYSNVNRKQFNTLGKSVGGFTSQTGAATSATLEFGRVLSDAPYGIRGVANNVQQLASNLFFMSKGVDEATGKTIGFGGALGRFGKSLLGPAGILVAFQGLTALLDFYSQKSKKASDSTIDFSKLVDSQAAKLMILKDVLGSTNVSLEDKKKIVSNVNNEFKDLNLTIDEQGKLTKTSQENIDKLTESLVKNAKAQAVLEKITEAQSKVVEIELERAKRIAEGGVGAFEGTLEDLEEQRQKYIDRTKNQIDKSNLTETQKKEALDNYMKSSTMQRFDALRDFRKKDLKDANEYVDSLTKMIVGEEMFSIFNKDGVEDKLPAIRDPKEFDKEAEDYLDQITKLSKKRELLDAKTQVEKIEIERKYHIENLQRKNEEDREEFVQEAESYKSKLKLFLDYQVKIGKMTKAQASQELSDFESNTKSQLDTMDENFPTLLIRWNDYYTKKAEAAKISEIGTMKPLKDEIKAEFTLQDGLKEYMKLQSSMTDFLSGEYDRQLTIEQNKTNALNNELNQRLLNEDLSKDERERIQLQIARNDESLRKKQEAIEKKRFKLNKAANIANATINTFLGASQVIGDKTVPSFAKPFVVASTIAMGLLQVAKIARQKFQSSAGSGGAIGAAAGSNGGGEGDSREFNFNLAGSTQSNQLTQSIASQLSQPIQTYVVSSEITTQQQLDLNIANTATIGG
jgi:hypothetical protein